MKKKIVSVILGLTLAMQTFSVFAAAKNLVIDGQAVEIPAEMGSLKEQDDRTFAPVRFIAETLGCDVKYNALTINGVVQESANITDPNGNRILLVSGSNKLFFFLPAGSGRSVTMDTNVFIDNTENRMYVPIRYLAEALDYTVGWDEVTETATLTKNVPAEETPVETPVETPAEDAPAEDAPAEDAPAEDAPAEEVPAQ